ncbi:MAG: sugar phosphate isomerase/epimerase [Verrucomicrobia bacterium]|nr:MAG: sugar phosphate isomerase/epimerase [Verrucomicrobiota bacterium]
MPLTRRQFTRLAAVSTLGLASGRLTPAAAPQPGGSATEDDLPIHLFSKHLQFLDYDDMARAAADLGLAGLDLTVRPGGHVEPEHVTRDLPRAVEAMRRHGLEPLMMVTAIGDADDPLNVRVLETAADLGLKYYRTAWYRFPPTGTWLENMQAIKARFDGLAALNRRLGLHGAYQNHAGHWVGAYLPDIAFLLDGTDPAFAGCQFDIRHATVEGGTAWPLGLRWVHTHIRTVAIKDFRWENRDGRPRLVNVPIGEGIVDFPAYFRELRKYRLRPHVSLHLEYDLGGAGHGKRTLSIAPKEVYAAIARDAERVRALWRASA